jgi:hypothetical protein
MTARVKTKAGRNPGLFAVLYQLVIPGHREAVSPESITMIVSMDSGLALRAPRNDDVEKANALSSVIASEGNMSAIARRATAEAIQSIRGRPLDCFVGPVIFLVA